MMPVDAGEQDAATAATTAPTAPTATAATTATTAPVATTTPTSGASYETDLRPPLPEPNPNAHHYKNPDGTCWETSMGRPPKPCPPGKKCPPQPTFNPPPPHQVKCQ